MQLYEYKVVPAPRRVGKMRGLKTTEDRFAHMIAQAMNDLGREGWEYLRADTLPCEERTGLTGKTTSSFQTVLVFRRVQAAETAPVPVLPLPAPADLPTPRLGAAQAETGAAPSLGPATAPQGVAVPAPSVD